MSPTRIKHVAFASLPPLRGERGGEYLSPFLDLPPMGIFDFDTVENAVFMERASEAAYLCHRGLLDLPYPYTMFSCWVPEVGSRCITLAFRDEDLILVAEIRIGEGPVGGKAYLHSVGRFDWGGYPKYTGGLIYHSNFPGIDISDIPPAAAQGEGASLMDPVVVLSMLLATRGVPKRGGAVDGKLQKARARRGKPPLEAVTRVDLRGYFAATASRGGTHASPRMHLRRGHIRRLPGREIWIRDMLVNADRPDGLAGRSHYTVKVDP